MLSLEVDISEYPGKLVLRMQDLMHLSQSKIARLQDELLKLVKSKPTDSVIVNMLRVKFCSSYTHNLLLSLQHATNKRPERIRLCELQPDALQVLQLTKTEQFFEIFETEDEALAEPYGFNSKHLADRKHP